MATNIILTRSYANNIYLAGTNSYENIEATRPEYVTPNGGPVMQYASDTFYIDDIDRALVNGWINPQQHADTLALKTPGDPQYRVYTMTSEQPV